MRDAKKNAVYTFERQLVAKAGIEKDIMEPAEIQALVKKVWADQKAKYKFKKAAPVTVVTAKNTRTSTYRKSGHKITLAAGWGQDRRVVLHELAHALQFTRFEGNMAAHGPEFVHIVIDLYRTYLGVDCKMALGMASVQRIPVLAPNRLLETA